MQDEGKSARTVQAYLAAIKGFTRWMAKHGKLSTDPLASVIKPAPNSDRRRKRRMLLPAEWPWIRSTTLTGGTRYDLVPEERVLLYAVAIQTGLRSNELRSLTRGQLFLDGEQPYITCRADSTKNRQDARQYIKTDVASDLRRHIATKAPNAPVFSMPESSEVASMFRADVEDARRAYLNVARHDPDEYARREQNDFLVDTNHEGEVLDFHCLRHTCGSWLAMTGAHPKSVQSVMRHSAITLTMDTYGHLFPGQEAETVARFPDLLEIVPDALKATGTDNAVSDPQQIPQQLEHEQARSDASVCEDNDQKPRPGYNRKPLNNTQQREPVRRGAKRDENASRRTRTFNPLIKSQLLCQLS